MPDIAPGLYATMSAADYFADPCPQPSLTQSIAKIILDQSPLHAWHAHPRLNPNFCSDEGEYTKPRAIGNASHRIVLGRGKTLETVRVPKREKVGNKYVVCDPVVLVDADDFKTDAAQQERDRIAAAGNVPMLRKHLDAAQAIGDAARRQLDLAGCAAAFRDGNAEVVMIAWDEENGVWLRSMADWMSSLSLLYDLKTGEQSAAPHVIPRRMVNDGWDVQAAMQNRILNILDPANRGRRRFRFVAVENEEPYGLTVNEMTETAMEMGGRKLRFAIGMWRDCLRRNEWPAYPPIVNRPEFPGYAETAWLNREIEEAGQARWPQDMYAPLPDAAE